MIPPRAASTTVLSACVLALTLPLAGCGSRTGSDATASTTPAPSTSSVVDVFTAPAVTEGCPTALPEGGTAVDWTLSGATGRVEVTGSTDTTAPRVTVQAPFRVASTQVQTLKAGTGPTVRADATVSVCYLGVNGRDGTVFDSSYDRGSPVEFGLDRVVPGFQKAIAGQKVGSTVAVAMVPEDGYPQGQPRAGIQPGDTLIFAIKILDASD